MNVLIIGSGGREHALAWKIAQCEKVNQVFVAPGNAGSAQEAKTKNVPIAAEDSAALVQFAKDNAIELTLVGPEAPLVNGIVDVFQHHQLPCLGPTQAAARLEGSKAFSKDFLKRYHIPTAAYETFTDVDKAVVYIHQHSMPIVIKADGFAAGKGVVIAQTQAQAVETVETMLSGKAFGEAGRRVVIEEFLSGEEASFMCLVDGQHILPLATSQDHKARDDGDKGPNTGGMGAYSPAAVASDSEVYARIMAEIIVPTVAAMTAEGHPYVGFLYAGLMIDAQKNPKVLEYNCRFGDPETQPILMRLRSDLVELCCAALEKRLHQVHIEWDPRAALGVVLAAGGYPGSYQKGDIIHGLDEVAVSEHTKVFHAGTAQQQQHIVTAGGRVLCVCALGEHVKAAQKHAYDVVKKIHWNDLYYRSDIGHRAI